MKKWNSPEIAELNVNETEHQWKFSGSRDGGYLGDGKFTGWFGPDPQPKQPKQDCGGDNGNVTNSPSLN